MPCGGGCGYGGSSALWPCYGYGESLVSSHAVGVGLCCGVRGSCRGGSSVSWFCGGSSALWSCHGCGGSLILSHAVGVDCRGFYFCDCGLILVGLWWWAV